MALTYLGKIKQKYLNVCSLKSNKKKVPHKNYIGFCLCLQSVIIYVVHLYRVRREKAEKLKKLEALGLVQPGRNIISLFISYGTRTHLKVVGNEKGGGLGGWLYCSKTVLDHGNRCLFAF